MSKCPVKLDRLDAIDVVILRLLQERGRIKRSEIAEEVGLSVPAVSDRMRKLVDRGVITGYHARLDAKRLHIDVTSFIRVRVDGSMNYPEFVEAAVSHPEILEVHSITGDGSHMLKARVRDTVALERLLSTIQTWPGVSGTVTSIVLSTQKEETTLQIEPVELLTAVDAQAV